MNKHKPTRLRLTITVLMAGCLALLAGPVSSQDTSGDGILDSVALSVGLSATEPSYGLMIHSTDSDFGRDRPHVAQDSSGNYHLVYRKGTPDVRFNNSTPSSNVGYMMISADGDILIDETDLTIDRAGTTASVNIAIGSDDKAHVIFTHRSDSNLRFLKIDPSLAAQDGSATTLAEIEDVAEIEFVGNYYQAFIKLDADDNAYIWSHDGTFLKLDSEGGTEIAPFDPFTNVRKRGHAANPIALDSDNNVHVIFQDGATTHDSISYGMLDGSDGSILIDETPVITELVDPPHAVHYHVLIDSNDMAHLVWSDKRGTPDADSYCTICSSGGTLYYAKIDPSLADQDGLAADMEAIKVIDDKPLGPYKYVQAFMDSNDDIHVLWNHQRGLEYLSLDSDGNIVTPSMLITTNAVGLMSWRKTNPATVAPDSRVFWAKADSPENDNGTLLASTRLKAPASNGAIGRAVGGRLAFFEKFDASGLPSGAADSFPADDFDATGDYFRFVVDGLPIGGTATITIDTGEALPENYRIIKFDGDEWFQIGTSRINDSSFSITLTDGGPGDATGEANGMIVDPIALAVEPDVVPVSASGSGGGCSLAGSNGNRMDPLLPLMMILVMAGLARRRLAN